MPYNTRSRSNGDLGDQTNSQQGQFVGQGQLAQGQSFDQALSGSQLPQQQGGYDQPQQGYGQQSTGYNSNTGFDDNMNSQQSTGYSGNTGYDNTMNSQQSTGYNGNTGYDNNSQPNYGLDQEQHNDQGEESLADKVENMLEKLANKISGNKESQSGNSTTGTGGFSNH